MNREEEAISGYYRFPTIYRERVVFVAEDDLWEVPLGGGVARRLTSHLGTVSQPRFSGDGNWLAFTACEEGPDEVYLMPSRGGKIERLTFLGAMTRVVGWRGTRSYLRAPSSSRSGIHHGYSRYVPEAAGCSYFPWVPPHVWTNNRDEFCWGGIPAIRRAGSAIGEEPREKSSLTWKAAGNSPDYFT